VPVKVSLLSLVSILVLLSPICDIGNNNTSCLEIGGLEVLQESIGVLLSRRNAVVADHSNISGEAVFTTSLVGYPESLTDPSYRGQILVFTQPSRIVKVAGSIAAR
jgi:hypothetical protein